MTIRERFASFPRERQFAYAIGLSLALLLASGLFNYFVLGDLLASTVPYSLMGWTVVLSLPKGLLFAEKGEPEEAGLQWLRRGLWLVLLLWVLVLIYPAVMSLVDYGREVASVVS